MSLTRGPPRSFFFGCIPPLLRPFPPSLPISVLSRIPRTGCIRCIGTRIRIVRTGPPPATTIFHSNRRIEKYWWLGRFYRVICQTTPWIWYHRVGRIQLEACILRAGKCVSLFEGALNLESSPSRETRDSSFRCARYFRAIRGIRYSRRRPYRYLSKMDGWISLSASFPDPFRIPKAGISPLWKLPLRSWIQLSASTLIFSSFLSVSERLMKRALVRYKYH